MIYFNKMWKNIQTNKKWKRHVKELEYNNVNLKEYLIIDVRSKREFKEAHLNGAINIPLCEIKKKAEIVIKDKNKKLIICCEYGIRSRKAVEILEDLGYAQVYNLKGGLENI